MKNTVQSPESVAAVCDRRNSRQERQFDARRAPLQDNRGIALVMTLAVMVLVTIMMIGFAVSMRVENMASKNFNDLIKARQLAQGAVDQAVFTLRQATPLIGAGSNYVTTPGMVYTYTGAWTPHPLFTITNDLPINVTNWVNLDASYVITGPGNRGTNNSLYAQAGITCAWVYVTMPPNTNIVGRYAYWVDDESAKINISVANTRASDLEGHTTAAIDLTAAFTNSDVSNGSTGIIDVRTPNDFNTLPSLYAVPILTNAVDKISSNQFHLTAYSTSPNLTPWGAPRLNVAALVTNATTPALKAAAVTTIATALSDPQLTAWYGKTFADKYPSVRQIAANIFDFISTTNVPTDSSTTPGDTTPPTYLGLKQTPYLNELVITNIMVVTTNSPPAPAGGATLTFTNSTYIELWNMYAGGWTAPAGTEVYLDMNSASISNTIVSGAGTIIPSTLTVPNPASPIPATAAIAANNYAVVSTPQNVLTATASTNNLTVGVTLNPGIITAIYRVNGQYRIDYAQIPLTNYTLNLNLGTLPYVNGTYTTNLNWTTLCNDPRVKPYSNIISNNWNPTGGGTARGTPTLGFPNPGGVNGLDRQLITTNPAAPTVGLRADGDASCHTIGSPYRDQGTFYPGDLAFIHTGVPWRTFWLQPQFPTELGTFSGGSGAPAIPDWAALDLFTADSASTIAGRINVNAAVASGNASFPRRLVPLYALLTNSVAGIPYNETNAVLGIYTNGYVTGHDPAVIFSQQFSTNGFTTVGELCEVPGLAPSNPGTTEKLKAETPTRGIANLVTPRSNVFTIWAIAQTIKEPPIGYQTNGVFQPNMDIITGEAKVQAIVERYEDTSTSPATVKFRTKYFRYLYQ